ncbi:MAG: hypothetical protein WCJ01_11690 [Ignavibacteria bacterium]
MNDTQQVMSAGWIKGWQNSWENSLKNISASGAFLNLTHDHNHARLP